MVQRRDEAAKAKASDHPHYRAIAQYTYDWESWIGPRGKVRWINPAVERITGYSVRECMQMSDYPLRMVVPGDRSRIAEALHSAARGSVGNDLEFRVLRKDGALRWVAMSWQSILERGRRRGYRTSIRDIDQRKAFEQALHEARHQAERAVRSKAEFLANVSHELRSPAQCIRGFAELMALSQLDESQRRYLRFIEEQSELLLRHVGDLLHYAALDAGQLELEREPFDVQGALRRILEARRHAAKERGLSLELWVEGSLPSALLGDLQRFQQVMGNLLDNALKFTERGRIWVVAQVENAETSRAASADVAGPPEGGEVLRIEVRDTGIGIPSAFLEQVLEPFVQVDASASRRHGGVGLGLAISQQLVRAMGGSLGIESQVGVGTCVSLRLPFVTQREEGERTSSPSMRAPHASMPPEPSLTTLGAPPLGEKEAELGHLDILVVDDSSATRALMDELLRLRGHRVRLASSGREALRLLQQNQFDVLFVDYQMPAMSGLALAQLVRAQSSGANARAPRLILMSANVFAEHETLEPSPWVDAWATKPLSLSNVDSLLRDLPTQRLKGVHASLAPQRASATTSERAAILDKNIVDELAQARSANGKTLLAMLLPTLRREQDEILARLEQSLAKGGEVPAHEIKGLVHKYKGNALLFGAARAANLAQELQELCEAKVGEGALLDVAHIARECAELRRAWKEAREALRAYERESKDARSSTFSEGLAQGPRRRARPPRSAPSGG